MASRDHELFKVKRMGGEHSEGERAYIGIDLAEQGLIIERVITDSLTRGSTMKLQL